MAVRYIMLMADPAEGLLQFAAETSLQAMTPHLPWGSDALHTSSIIYYKRLFTRLWFKHHISLLLYAGISVKVWCLSKDKKYAQSFVRNYWITSQMWESVQYVHGSQYVYVVLRFQQVLC